MVTARHSGVRSGGGDEVGRNRKAGAHEARSFSPSVFPPRTLVSSRFLDSAPEAQ